MDFSKLFSKIFYINDIKKYKKIVRYEKYAIYKF